MSGLVLEGISKRFNNVAAVDHVDLAVPNGTFVCMLGPSVAARQRCCGQ